jgi:hypothetical protein
MATARPLRLVTERQGRTRTRRLQRGAALRRGNVTLISKQGRTFTGVVLGSFKGEHGRVAVIYRLRPVGHRR